MSELACHLAALYLHPVKSCGGIAIDEALLVETGLDLDRAWMVIDAEGFMLTQRQLPRMALIRPSLRGSDMVLRAPGMLALHVSLEAVEAETRARVWDDEVKAYDMGALASQWFSDFLGRPGTRLVRFDPEQRRLSDPAWTGSTEAENAFSDGFPLLVCSTGSLAELNRRLAAAGGAPVTMDRFRPNLVLDGLEAHDEDALERISIETAEGPVRLRLVKPCTRCSIPNVDPVSGVASDEPGLTLAGYRANARLGGAITFGVNAVIEDGFDCVLRVGQSAAGEWRF